MSGTDHVIPVMTSRLSRASPQQECGHLPLQMRKHRFGDTAPVPGAAGRCPGSIRVQTREPQGSLQCTLWPSLAKSFQTPGPEPWAPKEVPTTPVRKPAVPGRSMATAR